MNISIIPPADEELENAISYYNSQSPRLGNQFYSAFNKTISTISDSPEIWNKIGKRSRKAIIKRFPYLILYVIHENQIFVTCIAHQHRDPRYYKNRA